MEEKELEQLESTKKLTAKQELFCQEYIKCLNQTTAYQKAYQCENRDSARKNASRLMTNEVVRKRVDELKAEIVQEYKITREQLIEKQLWVLNKAQEGQPEMKMNREGKFVPTGNKYYDFRAINDAVKNLSAMCGFNVNEVKAEIKANVESDVNIITAKDIANELMKK
jgi:phage terminase small subunit